MFVSTDGRTFREPPAEWAIGSWNDRSKWFAGSPQSLTGDLIREGITGVAGHVAEPLLGNTIRPNVLFPAYLAGHSLAEAFYLAMPSLSWMTVVVGDPLCAPFSVSTPSSDESPVIDPSTELPRSFAARRLAEVTSPGASPASLRDLVLAESRSSRGDSAGAREALERAVAQSPRLVAAQHLLASIYEGAGEYDRALETYQEILKVLPNDVLALNNLAFGLAERKADLAGALRFAEQAYRLAPRSGAVVDTLGWIQFMRGDLALATTLVTEAVRLSPQNAEIRLHLAQIHRVSGKRSESIEQLNAALELDPSLRSRQDVAKLLEERRGQD
jgi:Tfp pilus assembly protein PilF